MNNNDFYEIVSVDISLPKVISSGELNRILKKLGATLFYDVYSFERDDVVPDWQSECYLDLVLFLNGIKVDAQSSVDKIRLEYPLATVGSEFIEKFADLAEKISALTESRLELDGKILNKQQIVKYCDEIVSLLLENWGEEPGSESLVMMIEESY